MLQRHGWKLEHVRGSHHVLRKEGSILRFQSMPDRPSARDYWRDYSERRD